MELRHAPTISQKNQEPKTITHSDEKIALVLALAGGFAIWNCFDYEYEYGNSPCLDLPENHLQSWGNDVNAK